MTTVNEADEALLRTFVGDETVDAWQKAGAGAAGAVSEGAGEHATHVDFVWRAIEAAEALGRTVPEDVIDRLVGEAEERDQQGVPLTAAAVRESAGDDDAASGEFASLAAELGIVESADDALSIHGITTKTEG
ncbi:hypothetical protein [Conexibacter sp. CPCC 206217]|uniref:hypothetical protein n=1 Tax=Conexibacter sp. CPCC 206217 TaxID=3064574 RepID=UPI00271A35C7|nr:hypothetical protein [Conexibacter sp. CPCC 206217]MDO8213531.1 hypothetical protein [Conexibacter sp. CPCC 206217]